MQSLAVGLVLLIAPFWFVLRDSFGIMVHKATMRAAQPRAVGNPSLGSFSSSCQDASKEA